jgi:pimeloyl-ACP methyl ester carboxylesterase
MHTAIDLHWDGIRPVRPVSSGGPASGQMTVLIGGVNDRSGQAESFDRIWDRLHQDVSYEHGQAELCYYFWLARFKRGGQLNLLRYAELVCMADDAGEQLARYLAGLRAKGGDLNVALVGHSLGCRVALAAARALRIQHPHTRLLLLGAAVPEYECGMGGRYPRTAADATHTTLLWSDRDTGLGFWFSRGEWLALRKCRGARPPGSAAAVGRTGGPRDRWAAQKDSCGLRHKEYWTSKTALKHVAALLGEAREREQPARALTHLQPTTRSTHARDLCSREITEH